jgi:NADPH2:quinone reductase
MQAIRASRFGGPEVMAVETLALPEPGPGEVRVRVHAAGVNFIDVYQRTGLYPVALPAKLGLEGAGEVEALGPGVQDLTLGDRVAWSDTPGSYATHVIAQAARLVPIPPAVSFEAAAAVMLQGMTAHYLSHDTCPLAPGDTCLVHAAAGGVGLLLCQMAKKRGATVIGTVSTEAKANLARKAGADHVVLYTLQDFVREVQSLTQGKGVRVAYDSVGKTTWEGSLKSLAPRGMLVLFGQSSGVVPAFDPSLLARGGSLFLTRATLSHYVASREELMRRALEVLGWVAAGELSVRVERTFRLDEVALAHELLESRATTGKLLVRPV